ncbi:hypothetical protein [Roseivirga sp. UBA1976]|uniref:hypothetical protein n=2 Tax=Roseivirga TaxID=290180 RepID=UPI00257FDB53|nr:hypothetical protein [Roseivirga sp. UBA1976]
MNLRWRMVNFEVYLFTMKNILIAILLFAAPTLMAQQAKATKVVVRTQAKDAKFIGSSMGGSLIIIRDAQTNEILAKGYTKGGTGNTDLIMRTARERYQSITDGAAYFEASLSLSKPLLVTIEAQAPAHHEEARVMAQTQAWLIPGKPMDGEGIVVEIPGFVVDGLYPQTHQGFSLKETTSVELKANIVMMCGCTISDGGLWDAGLMEVEAMVSIDGEYVRTVTMQLKEDNTFVANLPLEKMGSYEVIISAYHIQSKNTGVDELYFRVSQ